MTTDIESMNNDDLDAKAIEFDSRPRWRGTAVAAAELQYKIFKPLRFVLPGLVPEGATLLVSRPKLGKSWLVLDLCLAVAGSRFTLGTLKPEQGDVLYLALEDGERRLQRRMSRLLPTFDTAWPRRLVLATDWERSNEGGLQRIEDWCIDHPERALIVVDTLEKFRARQTGNQVSYSVDYDAVAGLQKIASKYGVAVIIVHHDRKAHADDPFDTISGTLGLSGSADTILMMKREGRGVVLYVRGRDIEESETAVEFSKATCKWTILGAAADVHKSNERTKVVNALTEAGKPMKVMDIMIAAGLSSRTSTDVLLHRMTADEEVVRVGTGLYALPAAEGCKIGKKERQEGEELANTY